MDSFELHGGKYHITDEKDILYSVKKGHVLVYLLPVAKGEEGETLGRRMLLREAIEGEMIPSFCHDSEILGSWRFMLMALDHAEILRTAEGSYEETVLSFGEQVGLKFFEASTFEEDLIERYNLESVKEEGYIYATREEEKNTLKTSAAVILNVFRNNRGKEGDYVPVGHPLYDAVAYICRWEHIDIASYDKIRQAAGRKFALADISRISHFTTRSVILAGDWYKKDSGVLLAFTEEGNDPISCLPKGPGRYEYIDPDTGERGKIDADFAKTLSPHGYAFYRPFPDKPIGKMDLFLFGMRKVYKSDLIRLVFLALLGTGVGLLVPYLNQQVYDRYIPLGDMGGLLGLGGVILSCALGNITFSVVKNLASFRSMNSMEYAVQNAAMDRLFNLPESFFRDYDAAQLAQRVFGVTQIYQVIADNVVRTSLAALFSLMYLFRMFKYSKDMSRISLILLGIIVVLLIWLVIRQTAYEKEKLLVDIDSQSIIFQLISGIEKVRISASENRAILKYLDFFTRSQTVNAKKEKLTYIVGVVAEVAPGVFSLIFCYMMIHKSLDLSIGQFSGFTAAFGAFSAAVFSVVQSFLMVNTIKPIYDQVRPILETLPESSEEAALPGDLRGEVEVSHVTFGYSDSEEPVLKDLSLHIDPGEYVAIVGASGCGKSTLLKLLLGFEKPQKGKIFYDNRDIDDMDKRELRKKFGVVLQEGGMVSGSIYENIIITSPNAKKERVQQVIEEVGLKEDIDAMPMGIHTVVTEGTGTISGGQAQRIMIARALVGKPKLIFFDEATSALDNLTQNMVVETLERIRSTKLVIAHRLSTVRRCDRIIVMDKGRIIEEGSYEELMEMKGYFYELAARQL